MIQNNTTKDISLLKRFKIYNWETNKCPPSVKIPWGHYFWYIKGSFESHVNAINPLKRILLSFKQMNEFGVLTSYVGKVSWDDMRYWDKNIYCIRVSGCSVYVGKYWEKNFQVLGQNLDLVVQTPSNRPAS